MFTNISYVKTARSMNNPVGEAIQIYTPPTPNTTAIFLDGQQLSIMKEIDASYGYPLATKLYNEIPSSYSIYVYYYTLLKEMEIKATNPTILLLLRIIEHLLVGSINAFGLYTSNLMLTTDKTGLNTKINDILSNKNVKNVEVTCNRGTINMTQTFTLAPVFNAYILVYGLPQPGVGFDPRRVAF